MPMCSVYGNYFRRRLHTKVVLLPEVALIDLSVASTLGVARGGKKSYLGQLSYFAHQFRHGFFRIAKKHKRLIHVEEVVVDTSKAW